MPILDTAWVFVRRPIEGKPFFSADSEHLHHRLLQRGFSQQQIVLTFCGICTVLGLVDLAVDRAIKLVVFLAVVAVTMVVLISMTTWKPRL